MKLTNAYCEAIDKSRTHLQFRCPVCLLWSVWEDRITHERHSDCGHDDISPFQPINKEGYRQ